MKTIRAIIFAVLGVLMLVLSPALAPLPAAAQTTGTLVITTSTRLEQDHVGEIIIGADNITLDCNSHKVTQAGSTLTGVGISLSGRSGVTVKNCNASGFTFGFVLTLASSNNNLLNNRATGNGTDGFLLNAGSTGNVLRDNEAKNNGSGFEIRSSTDNTLVNNRASGNTGAGFFLRIISGTGSGNILRDNEAKDNGFGFLLAGANGNTLESNSASGNSTGFLFSESNGNTLRRNEAKGNGIGFNLAFSNDNTLIENSACGNRAVDAQQDFFSTGNIFVDNKFCTTEGGIPGGPYDDKDKDKYKEDKKK